MNQELKEKVKQAIRAHPKKFDMTYYMLSLPRNLIYYHPFRFGEFFECGTTACIAGFACAIGDPDGCVSAYSIATRAQELLKLPTRLGDWPKLFFAGSWPEDLKIMYDRAFRDDDRTAMAEAACQAIDRYDLEGEDWDVKPRDDR